MRQLTSYRHKLIWWVREVLRLFKYDYFDHESEKFVHNLFTIMAGIKNFGPTLVNVKFVCVKLSSLKNWKVLKIASVFIYLYGSLFGDFNVSFCEVLLVGAYKRANRLEGIRAALGVRFQPNQLEKRPQRQFRHFFSIFASQSLE